MNTNTPEAIICNWEVHRCYQSGQIQIYHYPYYLRSHPKAWREFGQILSTLNADRIILIADARLPRDWALSVVECADDAAPCTFISLESEGERNLETVQRLGNTVLQAGISRSSVLISLGSDFTENIVGMLAGILLDGVQFVHVPTSLVAMSDTALGSKQTVRSDIGHNHFGVIHPPVFVWSHLVFLHLSSQEEIQAALCHLIRNVLVSRPNLCGELMATLRSDFQYPLAQIVRFISLAFDTKCSLLANDGLEQRQALLLEYGQTIAQALEMAHPNALPPGHTLALGMVIETRIALQRGLLHSSDLKILIELLHRIGIPTVLPPTYNIEAVLKAMYSNQKRYHSPIPDKLDFILFTHQGNPTSTMHTVLVQIEAQEIREALERSKKRNGGIPLR